MIDFENILNEAKGKPILYKNKYIFRGEFLVLPSKKCNVYFRIVSTNSEWVQGIEININGAITIHNQKIYKGVRFWENTAPPEVVLMVETKDCKMRVDNVWDHGDGVIQKWVNGSAMYSEEIENGKRYYCNDGHPDDNFDDIVFELEITPLINI